LCFIYYLQDSIVIKVEKDDDLSEEDSSDTKSDEDYIPPSFSVKKAKPEVSHVPSCS
jgi:hypothetical protein